MTATASPSAGRSAKRQRHLGKRLFFGIFGAAFLFVIWNNERFLLEPHSPQRVDFHPIRWLLIPHGIGGAVALILGAMQFSSTFRRRRPRVHRTCGKLYVIGALILAPVAVWMAFTSVPGT